MEHASGIKIEEVVDLAFGASLEGEAGKRYQFRTGETIEPIGLRRTIESVKKNWYDQKLYPWYSGQNNEPEYLMRLITDNPTLMGLVLTKCTILYGEGPTLMRGTEPVPQNEWPEEIQDFFRYNRMADLIHSAFVDHEFLGNFFLDMRFTAGSSQTARKLAEVNRVSPECVRAYKPDDHFAPIRRYAVASAWDLDKPPDMVEVPAYQHRNYFDVNRRFVPGAPGPGRVIWHGKRVIPAFPVYSPPHWYGARYHIELQNEIPRWHIANILNMFGARVMVSVSQTYIQEKMQAINPATQQKYTPVEIRTEISKMVRDLFTKPENAGKVLLTKHLFDHQGRPLKDIVVESIKVETKDDAYEALEDNINNKITSSVGVQAALASLVTDKGMSRGSELTQAWTVEAAKARRVQRLVGEVLEFIHAYNGWDPAYTWAFPNPSLVTQDLARGGMMAPTTTQSPDNAV